MNAWTAYAIVWICMTVVVCTGIKMTGNWALIWFMLIPACISIHTKKGNEDESDKKDGEGDK